MNLSNIAPKVEYDSQGFWKTKRTENISYTKDGHNSIVRDEQMSFWFNHRHNCLKQLPRKYFKSPVLDVGGGNGVFTKYLQNEKIESILLEPGFQGVKNAVKNEVKNIVHSSLKEADFIDSSISTVVLLDVLEHVKNDEEFLIELNRILTLGGHLIITVPALQSLFSDFDREVGHFRRYSLSQLNKLLQKSGFSIEYKSYFFYFLPIPILIGRFIVNKFKKEAKRKSTGHLSKATFAGFCLTLLLLPEQWMIKYKIKIPFGSSCLITAKKLHNAS